MEALHCLFQWHPNALPSNTNYNTELDKIKTIESNDSYLNTTIDKIIYKKTTYFQNINHSVFWNMEIIG